MLLLAIETTTAVHSVALLENDRVLGEHSQETAAHRGGWLLPAIDRLLHQTGLAVKDLEAVAVTVGPGSFTGVRVGLATAKGLARGTGAALVGLSTLEVLAEGYAVPDITICALLDARRAEVFMALFRRVGAGGAPGALERLSDDAVLSPEAVEPVLARADGPVHLIGDGAKRYRERFLALGGPTCLTEAGLCAAPSASVAGRLAWRRLAGGGQVMPVDPVYLRRAEAEVNWEKDLSKSSLARTMR